MRTRRRRATRREEPFSGERPDEETGEGVEPSERILVGVASENGSERQPGWTPHAGRAELRAMTVHPIHPLEVYIRERRVRVGRAALLLGLSERTLRDVLAFRVRLSSWRESDVAADLGVVAEELFPSSCS